ncbi:hypothetical protein SAMN05421780_102319 [Flexibacter flexilis DSM 6793]|uniref:Uncharacterized protein n=1 Tax=Flexibacter flexilis DSM 6793 TaxID=927664 RepID=A0A1I1FUL0_9BACT|nr:hypothetical protein [Flexibacter flexilis]SFC02732.1 hypothetical protein SAMN05421780_102319 [Flexibacter flexilis DSM 6793]
MLLPTKKLLLVLLGSVVYGSVAHGQFVNNGGLVFVKNKTTVAINGSLINKAGILANEGRIFVGDSLKNYGNYRHLNGVGIDTIVMTSSSPTGILMAAADTVGALHIQGGGQKTLSGNLSVNKSLILQNGLVNTSAGILTVQKNGQIYGGDNTAYVDGPMTYLGQGVVRRFPVGIGGQYHPVILKTVAGTNDNFAITFEAKSGGTPVLGESVADLSNIYWERSISNPSNFSGYDSLVLSYAGATPAGATSPEQYIVAQSTSQDGVYQGLGSGFVSGTLASGFTRNFFDPIQTHYRVGRNNGVKLKLRVVLQGAYAAGAMDVSLKNGNYLNNFQANNAATVYTMPNPLKPIAKMLPSKTGAYLAPTYAVDVIQISARATPEGPDLETITAWLLADGSVVDYLSGGLMDYVTFPNLTNGSYHFVVRHRNHLDIMTDDLVSVSTTPPSVSYDLTDIANVYGSGALLVNSSPAVYAMIAGDNYKADGMDETNGNDLFRVNTDQDALSVGYLDTNVKFDNDVAVNASDYTLSSDQNDNLYFSTVP